MGTIKQRNLVDKIINGLKKAAVELEEFRLQTALGKAEAHDVFEDAKKRFNKFVRNAKAETEEIQGIAKEKSMQVKVLFETLQVQLSLGKAEGKEAFETQRKKITKALNELENYIKEKKTVSEYSTKVLLELGKFRIKLDILKLHYELNKLNARLKLSDTKKDLDAKFAKVKKRLLNHDNEEGWGHFKDEIYNAYSHLKKAFAK
jgi:hypothetical protein